MIRNVKHLNKFDIVATDGSIGSVDDIYFDDERWAIRYLVVDTGKWLSGRHVLVSPLSVVKTEWGERRLLLSITRDQVRNSPDVDTHKPVSRQHEANYLKYYGYPPYWGHTALWGAFPYPMLPSPEQMAELEAVSAEEQRRAAAQGDTHLRSISEVTGYLIRATDGELGHVDDFLIDDVSWAVRYLVINTSNWWFGKQVLAAPSWISGIQWASKTVDVRVTRQAIRNAPLYDRAEHVDRQWEVAYHQQLNQPGYWLDEEDAAAIKEAHEFLQERPQSQPDQDPLERRAKPR